MTTTHADPTGIALLAEVLRVPAEDTPRLVYADWLQEQGERHLEWMAVFIRAAIRNGDDDAQGEFQRTIEHTNPHDGAAAFGLPEGWDVTCYAKLHELRSIPAGRDRPSALTRRGFVSEVTCSAADWLAHSTTILAAHPVARVTLTTIPKVSGWALGGAWLTDDPKGERFPCVNPFISDVSIRDIARDLLGKRFPGITFALPPG